MSLPSFVIIMRSKGNYIYSRDILGGVPKILAECVVLWDPENWCFIAFLSDNFRLCCSMGPNFPRKNLSKIRYIFEIFFKKSMFYASKWSQMVRFWRNLMKSPIKLHTGCFSKIFEIFQNFRKFLKIWPPKPPKIHFLLHF